MRKTVIAVSLVAAVAVVAGPALAGGKGNRGGGKTTVTGSFSLILLNSSDGLPHYGQDVTFEVTSNAFHPMVRLTCYQGGEWVKNQSVGFWDGWAWSQVFPLSSYKWPGGAADCDAKLYHTDHRGREIPLATMSFRVHD